MWLMFIGYLWWQPVYPLQLRWVYMAPATCITVRDQLRRAERHPNHHGIALCSRTRG